MTRIENIAKLLFAVFASFPLFYKSHWLMGVVSVLGLFIVLHTVYWGMMHMASYRREDGYRYIASSARGLAEMFGMGMCLLVTTLCFMLFAHLVGWNLNQS